jgi:hypothetical protein
MATIRSARALGVVPSANVMARVRTLRVDDLKAVLTDAQSCVRSEVPAVARLAREVLAAALVTHRVEELDL